MLDPNIETLVIAQEECAEVIKEISKVIRFGLDNKHPNESETNRDKLTQEIGDLLCMIDLMIEKDIIDIEIVHTCKILKREKLKRWSGVIK